MNEDFVPFELAVKLKEKWFPQEDSVRYDEQGELYIGDNDYPVCVAPTISQVLKWLREEKMWIIVIRLYEKNGWYWFIQDNNGELRASQLASVDECFSTYEQAALVGIEYVLDNLI